MVDDRYQISFSPHPAGVRVHVTGQSTLDNTMAYWREIAAYLRGKPQNVLLVDEMQGAPLDAGQWEQLVRSMAGEGLERVRIAHVKPQGLHAVEYCEIHAREAGIDASTFADEDAADLWLRYGER